MSIVSLKPGKERSLLRHHPWVFSGAVQQVSERPGMGGTVRVEGADGRFLGWGGFSPHSQMRVRMWSFLESETIDAAFFHQKIQQAITARAAYGGQALRLIHAESDGLPGLVVDRYADTLVCQFLAAGVEHWKQEITASLAELLPGCRIYERSDDGVREKEGMALKSGPLVGDEPPELIEIQENGLRFLVDVRHGHKTGFYLDQRENRTLVGRLAQGREVLNVFSYTGGFGLAALAGGAARVTNLESSAPALALAERHVALNGLDASCYQAIQADAFPALRTLREQGERYDMVVLDPPKFVDGRANLEKALRGYKDINLQGCRLLRPGGILVTFSCSGLVEPLLFQQVVTGAAQDAHRHARVTHRLTQAPDHAVALSFPEGEYLKGLVCQLW